ncbi:PREDICTED: membrane metallo-endopeptidase-like 1 [Dinoponera quadriceps]|uniref:Membrane metallo-endopeptidase-like 1 n=1 Tax=Dinoponera quadriceps TaxID=609295 RepID=A0A6P3WX74_DINQU|nr:PREDICTED: membrane metallo-endopeptidase-like 1 [Dinoponera quadriceps]
MRWFALFVFVGVLQSVIPLKYPSNLAWLFGLNDEVKGNKKGTVCLTEECEKIAKVILESMDKSVNPCDDFYEYACGKWSEHNPVPEGSRSWSLWEMLQNNVDRQIEDILKEGPKDNDLLAVKLAKKWYTACMDTDERDKRGLDPLVSTQSRIGGWPMIMDPDEWDEQEYSWQKVDDQYMRLMGRNAFHDVYVYGFNETVVVHVDTPHLPPGAYILWSGKTYDSDEVDDDDDDPSDEDRSDEEKQSHEDSQEPGNEASRNDDDNKDDNDTNEQADEAKKKKKKTKSTDKLHHRKNKIYSGRKGSNKIINKHKDAGNKKLEKRAITMKVDEQRIRHSKLNRRKNTRKALEKTSSTPQFTTEETNDDDGMMMTRQQYADYISKVAYAIAKERGMKVSERYIDADIEDMIEFQLKLTEIVMESGEDLELTLDDFQEWYDKKKSTTDRSKIDWVHKITELFDEANVAVDGYLDVEVGSPDYFEALVSLLDETSSRTIVNYIHWNFLSKIIKTTTSEMRELYDAWEEVHDEEREPRSSECIREVEMSDILAYEYVRKHFSDDITKTAMDMIDDIQKEVEYLIKESDWMDDDTKDFVLVKLVNMDKLVGYPDWYRNTTIVKRYFQGLIIGKSYYENTLSYLRYYKWNSLRMLTQDDEDLDAWWISPVTLNALFDPEGNSIAITAADFQSPFFAYGRPQTINFGIIGFIMAHEVNHGFDDTGHLYDKNGNFMEWLSTMADAYGKRAECFVEQFNNYPIDKISNKKLKNYGNQTAGENIADTMGLQAVFRAYQRRERECGKPDAVLPGLEGFTNDQLFFLSFGNLWCEATDSTTAMRDARMDSHSTGRLRVIGSVSNSENFAKAYNCPVGSAMNPEKKCNIWK